MPPREEVLRRLESQEPGVGLATRLLSRWKDGRIKLFVTWKMLELRRKRQPLFRRGDYVPLVAEGKRAPNICALARTEGTSSVIVAVPRMLSEVVSTREFPLGEVWGETTLPLPKGSPDTFRNIFTEERVQARDGSLQLREVFASFPVAVLESAEQPALDG